MLSRLRPMVAALLVAVALPASGQPRDLSAGLVAYESGEFDRALAIFRPMVERGDPGAQFMLGAMYFYGRGVRRDDGSAAIMFQKAATQGNPEAQLAFGSLLLYSVGIRQDLVKSYMWLTLASNSENADVSAQARELKAHATKIMTKSEIERAVAQARNFRPRRPHLVRGG